MLVLLCVTGVKGLVVGGFPGLLDPAVRTLGLDRESRVLAGYPDVFRERRGSDAGLLGGDERRVCDFRKLNQGL